MSPARPLAPPNVEGGFPKHKKGDGRRTRTRDNMDAVRQGNGWRGADRGVGELQNNRKRGQTDEWDAELSFSLRPLLWV